MIKNWHVENFKSIKKLDIELAPLTILCGVNSSGKSSFLQTMALLAQAALFNKHIPIQNYKLGALPITIGSGYFGNIYNKYTTDKSPISISFTIEPNKTEIFKININFDRPSDQSIILPILNFRMEYKKIKELFYIDNNNGIDAVSAEQIKKLISKEISSDNLKIKFPDIEYDVTGFLPSKLLYPKKPPYKPLHLYNDKNNFSTANIKENIKESLNYPHTFNLPEQLEYAKNYLHNFFALKNKDNENNFNAPRIEFLLPLRAAPNIVYPNIDSTKEENVIDAHGSYIPDRLHNLQNEYNIINYYSPNNLNSPETFNIELNEDIKAGISKWLYYLDITDKDGGYETNKIKNIGMRFKILYNKNISFDLPQLGTGTSQVIPILAKCLLSPPGSVIVIEQPESQLHPKMQSKLADFFIAMALSGRQIIIETHSEYIIDKISLFYAKTREDKINKKIKDDLSLYYGITAEDKVLEKFCKIYFSDKVEGVTYFNEVEMNEFGVIPEWPPNFVDEEALEIKGKVIREALKKRKEIENSKPGNPNG